MGVYEEKMKRMRRQKAVHLVLHVSFIKRVFICVLWRKNPGVRSQEPGARIQKVDRLLLSHYAFGKSAEF